MSPRRSERATDPADPVSPADAADPLDAPVLSALAGVHRRFARRRGRVLRYQAEAAPFAVLPDDPGPQDWADLSALSGPGGVSTLVGRLDLAAPDGWETVYRGAGVQLSGAGLLGRPVPEAVRLGPDDAGEMLDLVARTRPGPFLPRTVELGTYLGIRRDGKLVAMAGERLQPAGWSELSAVCTDDAHRGEGLATRLVLGLVALVQARGATPFLHAATSNTGAIRLYESLGFQHRRDTEFLALREPSGA
jgi:GNAT superfamily N-acetyltransferase